MWMCNLDGEQESYETKVGMDVNYTVSLLKSHVSVAIVSERVEQAGFAVDLF